MSIEITQQERMELVELCGVHIGNKWKIDNFETFPTGKGPYPEIEIVFTRPEARGVVTIRIQDPDGGIEYCVKKIKSRIPEN